MAAVSIEGHPTAAYNGLYTHDSEDEGWPVLKNAHGKFYYCFKRASSARYKTIRGQLSGLHPTVQREVSAGAGRKRKRLPDHAFPLAFEDRPRLEVSGGSVRPARCDVGHKPWYVRPSPDAKSETHSLTVTLVSSN